MASLASRTLKILFKNIAKPTKPTKPIYHQHRFASTDAVYKAAVVKAPDEPLEVVEKTREKLGKDQVRIQVEFCSVNSVDCVHFKDGSIKLPFVPGYELSGEVVEVGKNVKKEQILLGETVAAFNPENFGGFAEECVVDIDDVWRLPSNVSAKEAAVLIYGHGTALFAFSKLHKPADGDHIVVTAGPAGLGLAAVDVAANVYKAKVIGVVDSDNRAELLRERGAFETIGFHENIYKDVFKKTDKKGADIVYDAVGEHMLPVIGQCVTNMGNIFHAAPYGYTTLPVPSANSLLCKVSLKDLRMKDKKIYRNVISDTLELANEGVLGTHVSATFNLKSINDAIKYIEDKKCTGKVVIKIDD